MFQVEIKWVEGQYFTWVPTLEFEDIFDAIEFALDLPNSQVVNIDGKVVWKDPDFK